jgi:hypothetical protein
MTPAAISHPFVVPSPRTLPEKKRRLRDLRGVGPHIEQDLRSLGVYSVDVLARRDGYRLYDALCKKTGVRQDPCVLDTFRCAVAQARNPSLPGEQANWWWWSKERKAGRL